MSDGGRAQACPVIGEVAELARPLPGKQSERETVVPDRTRPSPPDLGCLAQSVEHRLDKAVVDGSIPSASTNRMPRWCSGSTRASKSLGGSSILSRGASYGRVPELVKRRALETRWPGNGRRSSNLLPSASILAVAQLEERRATNAEARGSTPFSEASHRV